MGVETDNNDSYLSAYAILTEALEDERVGVVLFNTRQPGYGSPIEARQVWPLTNPDSSDFYAVVIRLFTVVPGQ